MSLTVKGIRLIKEKIASVFSEEDVAAAYIFGSRVDGSEIPSSDIDLAVLFKKPPDFKQELDLGARLELKLRCEVDVLNLNCASINLAFRAISCGTLIYEKEPIVLSDYLEHLFGSYQDFRPKFEIFLREYNQSLREYYLHA